jgi:hypothetical protein
MSKYLSGVYSTTYACGGPPPQSPTAPTNNFVYGNQYIQGVIQLTADTKTSLQNTYGASGVYIGLDAANAYAGLKLLGPTSANNGSYIDFTTAGVTYKGRILYDNSVNSMKFYTNSASTAAMAISSTSVATMYGGISTDGAHSFTLPTTAGTNYYVLTSDGSGGTSWAPAIGGGGSVVPVSSGGTGVNILTTNAVLVGNGTNSILSPAAITYSGGILTLLKLISNDTTTSTSTGIGAVLLSGGIGINNTTDAISATNGGTFTSAGGGAFAKSLWVGSTMNAPFLTLNNSGTNVPLLINMTNTNSLAIMSRMLAASLNTGYDCETWLGVSASNYNCMIMRFNYVAATQNTNYLDLGFYGANNLFLLYGSGVVKITTNIASTSSTTGVLTLVGGLGIANTTDATSTTNGGGLTCAGGGAFAKQLWLGGTLNINIAGSGNTLLANMLVPSLGNGNNMQIYMGVAESNYNTSIMQFNYVSSSASGFSGNNIGFGFWNANNILNVYTSGARVSGQLTINNSGNTNSILPFNILAPNLPIGANNYVEMHIGVQESNLNTGIINFNYVGNGSSNNSLGLGIWGGLNVLQVYTNGVAIAGEVDVNSTATSGGAVVGRFFAYNLNAGTGSNVQILLGTSTSDYPGCAVIQYNNINPGLNGPSGNSLGFGFNGNNNIMTLTSYGLKVNGNITKSSGSFDIPHPDPIKQKKKYRLRHCFVESNTRGDNLYRYTVVTNGGETEIQLPDYFQHLNENPQVFITAIDVFGFSKGWVDTELKKVHVMVSVDGTYNVLVIGTRKDKLAVKYFDPLGIEYIED